MKKVEKPGYMNSPKFENHDEDLAFLLWKAELDKEIIAFWKAMIK